MLLTYQPTAIFHVKFIISCSFAEFTTDLQYIKGEQNIVAYTFSRSIAASSQSSALYVLLLLLLKRVVLCFKLATWPICPTFSLV